MLTLCTLALTVAPQEFEYTLRPPNPDAWSCGGIVAIEDDWIFVGSASGNSCPNDSEGLPALFRRNVNGRDWDFVQALSLPGSSQFRTGGEGVDMSGPHLVAKIGNQTRQFLFDAAADSWVEGPVLTSPLSPGGNVLAEMIDISGNRMLVIESGVPNNPRSAQIYGFDLASGVWVHETTLPVSGSRPSPWGWLDGDTAGFSVDHDLNSSTQSEVWIYERIGGA